MSVVKANSGTESLTKVNLEAYLPRTTHQRFADWLLSNFYKYDINRDGRILSNELQRAASDYVSMGGPTGPYLVRCCQLLMSCPSFV